MGNVIIRTETGAEYSVDEKAFRKHYPDVAYEVIGDETAESFEPVGIPKQKPPRRSPRRKAVKKAPPKAVTPPAADAPSEPA